MFGFLKKKSYSIGIDIDDDNLKMVQLENGNNTIRLVSGFSEPRPDEIKTGTGNWQRWAIDSIRQLSSNGNFMGKEVIAAIPAADIVIDHIKMPKVNDNQMEDAIFSKIKQKLPSSAVQANTLMKYIPTEQDNLLVMATDREMVNRYLAIYEKSGLTIKSIGVWPLALTNCYTRFFGRRQTDLNSVVMIVSVDSGCTNAVICRHKNVLFARSIPIGIGLVDDPAKISSLVLELTSFKRQFCSTYRNIQIERLIFFSSKASDRDTCASIAKQMEMPAQMGDCLAAVDMTHCHGSKVAANKEGCKYNVIDRRDCRMNWSVAFGLSLS
jgi:Tfp pilus assembly PilM family ATPase